MKKSWVSFLIILSSLGALHAQTNTFPTSGNVGIGTTSPATKLEVVGTVKVTDTTASTAKTNGSLVLGGGLGVGQNLYTGGFVNAQRVGVSFPASVSNNHYFLASGQLDASGTSTVYGIISDATITGTNGNGANTSINSIRGNVIASGTAGTLQNANSFLGVVRITDAMSILSAPVFSANLQIVGSGNVTDYMGFSVAGPVVTSTGNLIGTSRGLLVNDIGRATATTISGVDVTNQTKGSGDAYAYRGQMVAATGKYNAYMSGSAANFFAGNVGIGTASPSGKLTVATTAAEDGIRLAAPVGAGSYAGIRFEGTVGGWALASIRAVDAGAFNGDLVFHTDGDSTNNVNLVERMRIASSGNVGIGTTSPTHKLAVNGTIRAKEVIVESTPWPDYVFASDYNLAPLAEVESHIKEKGHLPGIPSAQEVAEQGVSMGMMQAKLLAKIEELTLHQIAQEKRILALETENRVLKTR